MPTPSEGRSAAYKRRWRFFGGRFKGFGLVEAEWTPGKRVRRARVIFRVRVLRRLQTKITGKPLTWTTDEIMALHGFTREELE